MFADMTERLVLEAEWFKVITKIWNFVIKHWTIWISNMIINNKLKSNVATIVIVKHQIQSFSNHLSPAAPPCTAGSRSHAASPCSRWTSSSPSLSSPSSSSQSPGEPRQPYHYFSSTWPSSLSKKNSSSGERGSRPAESRGGCQNSSSLSSYRVPDPSKEILTLRTFLMGFII